MSGAAGDTAGEGFQVGVRRTLPVSAEVAWSLTVGRDGLGRWVGGWEPDMREGTRFTALNGSSGEILTVQAGRSARLSWTPARTEQTTLIQLTVEAAEGGACVVVDHEKLADEPQRAATEAFWDQALEGLARRAG